MDNRKKLSCEQKRELAELFVQEIVNKKEKIQERIKPDKDFINQIFESLIALSSLEKRDLNDLILSKLDLSEVNFDGICVEFLNLKGTNAKIDPQKVKNKSLLGTNLSGINLSNASFDGVNIGGANLVEPMLKLIHKRFEINV